jgi:hypothetical protein
MSSDRRFGVPGGRDEQALNVPAAVDAYEMLSSCASAQGLALPLGLHEIHVTVEFNGSVDLFNHSFALVADKGKGFSNQDALHREQPVKNRFKQLATAVRVGLRKQ